MSRLKVFIVEDNPTIRQNLTDTLEELAPVEVVGWAADAGSALEQLQRDPPVCGLAIVDLFLRGGSGIQVLEALQHGARSLRRVVLTNVATPAVSAHCLALGAERVFDKSTEVEALVDYCVELAAAV